MWGCGIILYRKKFMGEIKMDLTPLAEALAAGRLPKIKPLVSEALAAGVPAKEILENGLLAGMKVVGDKFKAGKMYVPEVMLAARCMQTGADSTLLLKKTEEAKKAAEEYRDIHLDICYCSPLKRAEQTARIVLSGRKTQVPVVIDDRLIEMGFGEYEGVQNSFNISDCNVNVLFRNPDRYIADKGAESLDELFERTGQFLDEVIQPELAKGRDILIVGHGAMNSSIICQIRGKTYAHFWDEGIENCRLKRLI